MTYAIRLAGAWRLINKLIMGMEHLPYCYYLNLMVHNILRRLSSPKRCHNNRIFAPCFQCVNSLIPYKGPASLQPLICIADIGKSQLTRGDDIKLLFPHNLATGTSVSCPSELRMHLLSSSV